MIEQLFGSKTRVKLLQLFMSNPNRAFYVREITRKVEEQINSVRRELSNLLSIGVITSDTSNNRLYYEVNQDYEYYEPLSAIFGDGSKTATSKPSIKSDEVSKEDKNELARLGNVRLAFMTGQFTRDDTSGVDLFLVGDLNATQVENYVAELEKNEKKEIRYVVFSSKDFDYRQKINDRFTINALASKKLVLIDKDSILAK